MSQILVGSSGGGGGGVTSVTGTANEVTATPTTGAVVVSTPSTFIAPGTSSAVTQILAPTGTFTAPGLAFSSTPSMGFIYVNSDEFDVIFSQFNQTVRFLSTQTVFAANLVTEAGISAFFGGGVSFESVKTPGAYPYTTLSTDALILVDTSSARTINLVASPNIGMYYMIKDNVGSAITNHITIVPAAGNIDGSATYSIITAFGFVQLIYNGTQWNVVAKG